MVGLRLPEQDEEETGPLTRVQTLRPKLAEVWLSVAGFWGVMSAVEEYADYL